MIVVPEKQSMKVGGGMGSRKITPTANTIQKMKQGEALNYQSLPSVVCSSARMHSLHKQHQHWGPSIQIPELMEGIFYQTSAVYKPVFYVSEHRTMPNVFCYEL